MRIDGRTRASTYVDARRATDVDALGVNGPLNRTSTTSYAQVDVILRTQNVITPFTRYNRFSNRLYNRFDNRLYRVNGVYLFRCRFAVVIAKCSRGPLFSFRGLKKNQNVIR